MSHENKTNQTKSSIALPTTRNNLWALMKKSKVNIQFKITLCMYINTRTRRQTYVIYLHPIWMFEYDFPRFLISSLNEIMKFFLLNGKTRHINQKKCGFASHETIFRFVCVWAEQRQRFIENVTSQQRLNTVELSPKSLKNGNLEPKNKSLVNTHTSSDRTISEANRLSSHTSSHFNRWRCCRNDVT